MTSGVTNVWLLVESSCERLGVRSGVHFLLCVNVRRKAQRWHVIGLLTDDSGYDALLQKNNYATGGNVVYTRMYVLVRSVTEAFEHL